MDPIKRKRETIMPRRLGKFMLIMHIVSSVGWLGAVAGFLVLSVAGLTSRDVSIVRAAYLSMNLIGFYLLVPLSFASLLTGIVQSLGTSWGLFRQYWTIAKLVLTLGSVALLLLHQFMAVARAAQRVMGSPLAIMPHVGQVGTELAIKAALAIGVLLLTTTLSVYKPWGLTPYGRRLQRERQMDMNARTILASADTEVAKTGVLRPRVTVLVGILGTLMLLLAAHLLLGHGIHGHGF